MKTQFLSTAINAAFIEGNNIFQTARTQAAQNLLEEKSPLLTAEDEIEINRIFEEFLASVKKELSSGSRRVCVMKVKHYDRAKNLRSGRIDIEPNRMRRVPCGVYKALVEAGFKPQGLASFDEEENCLDLANGRWIQEEFTDTVFSAPPIRTFKQIEMFVEFPYT